VGGAVLPSRTRFAGQQGRAKPWRKDHLEESSDESWSAGSSEEADEDHELLGIVDDDDEDHDNEEEDEEMLDDIGAMMAKKTKPEATRVILEVDALSTAFSENCRCTECNSKVEVELKTTCLATSIELTCMNNDCGYIYYSNPPAQVKTNNEDKRERSTDYAVNILYVLGFICCGDGCTEAARVLGLMGLPNDTTMEGRSFGIIEERIGPAIRALAQEILLENLVEEVGANNAFADPADFERWKSATKDKSIEIHKTKYPKVPVSYDMAWQQRSSGVKYASPSGHALLFGGKTKRPISLCIKSKLCNFCNTWKKRNSNNNNDDALLDMIPEHFCLPKELRGCVRSDGASCLFRHGG
jgi:hypothetical protein